MTSRIRFLAEYIKNLRGVGALTQSSRNLAEKMVRPVDFSTAKCIVEFGGGDGAITTRILPRLAPEARLFTFETNSLFARILQRIPDSRLTVINDSAARLPEYLARHGAPRADAIISCLPLTSLPDPLVGEILSAVIKTLKPGGCFVQFQYSLSSYREFKKLFREVRLDFSFWNLPPAFVYICKT